MTAYTVDLSSITTLDAGQFFELCRANPDVKFERSAQGKLIIMSPTGGETSNRNFEMGADFAIWNRRAKLGVLFDSSTCFQLPNGGDRSPDIAWVRQSRWDTLTPEQKEKFPPIAPDFVLELMSPSDRLKPTQEKMQEYMDSGVRLGWLIQRNKRQVEVYRQGQPVEILNNSASLSGEQVLPGFVLQMSGVW